jgi:hypothetical protein
VPSHRQSAKHRRPKHRRQHSQGRPGPARLTLTVAAATVAVGAASAGVAVAAAGPGGSTGSPRHLAGGATGRESQRTAGTKDSGRATVERAAQQAADPQATGAAGHATSRPELKAKPAASPSLTGSIARKPTQAHDFLVYDSVLPSALPKGQVVAVYATGGRPAQPAELAGRGPVLWIDNEGTDPAADVLDVEPGCASPAVVPAWVTQRLTARPGALAIVYTTINEWPTVQAEVAGLPAAMRAQVRWWIADPTGYAHVVPGSDATQWYWGSSYDISTATPRFL